MDQLLGYLESYNLLFSSIVKYISFDDILSIVIDKDHIFNKVFHKNLSTIRKHVSQLLYLSIDVSDLSIYKVKRIPS